MRAVLYMDRSHIRNFSIIAHIDHGKSTLADRLLEETKTVEERKMREQLLDVMDLERERGITIKMQPVRMAHRFEGEEYILNLIDTPGHIDFAYEVSRALKAVEGAILLVDATQGVQAQTLSTLSLAQEQGLTIIPVLSKIDSPLARVSEMRAELATLLGVDEATVLCVSGKTGEGVPELLDVLVERLPAPAETTEASFRGLVFDFAYSNHRGVIVYTRVFDGAVKKGDALQFVASGKPVMVQEVGVFHPEPVAVESIAAGEIGYIVTGIKEPNVAAVGDTLRTKGGDVPALAGYQHPQPVVFASLYPENQDDFSEVKRALERLQLTDSSLTFEEEGSSVLGKGFRCGFLGMLHLEIVTERLRREFDLSLIVTSPSVTYRVRYENGTEERIYSPSRFPEHGAIAAVYEPWVSATVIAPADYVGPVLQLLHEHEAEMGDTEMFGDGRTKLAVQLPLRELMRGFFDRLKSSTAGYASLSYTFAEERPAQVARLDVLVAEEVVPAFSRVVSQRRLETEARQLVERLYSVLPRQQFPTKIQAQGMGRIVASKTLPAMRKDVTGALYGGDVTRKRKLLEKQKKGKKKLAAQGRVSIPQEVFLKMVKQSEDD